MTIREKINDELRSNYDVIDWVFYDEDSIVYIKQNGEDLVFHVEKSGFSYDLKHNTSFFQEGSIKEVIDRITKSLDAHIEKEKLQSA